MKINKLERVSNLISLLNYMGDNCENYDKMIHKYNDISISVNARKENRRNNNLELQKVDIMKEYLKDTSKEIHILINNYYNKK